MVIIKRINEKAFIEWGKTYVLDTENTSYTSIVGTLTPAEGAGLTYYRYYTEKARGYCRTLPYNSGMVDVDLLHGIYLTEKGGDAVHLGIQELQHVVHQGTTANRAKAYHQLAQTYLKSENGNMAEILLDSMYSLLNNDNSSIYISLI